MNRYDMYVADEGRTAYMQINEYGEFVLYVDYDKLAKTARETFTYYQARVLQLSAENEFLVEQRNSATKEIVELQRKIQWLSNKITEMQWTAAYDREMNMVDDREMGR